MKRKIRFISKALGESPLSRDLKPLGDLVHQLAEDGITTSSAIWEAACRKTLDSVEYASPVKILFSAFFTLPIGTGDFQSNW